MTGFWVVILIFRSIYTVQHGQYWVFAQSLTNSLVYQPDKEVSVDIGDSATLRCCVSEQRNSIVSWFKQQNRKEPQIILRVFKNGGETYYNDSQKSRFKIEIYRNCINIIILTITQSDEATYYCASRIPYTVFGDGTHIKINDEHAITASEEKTELTRSLRVTVLVLGTALGLCVLVIFSLAYFILKRRKHAKTNVAISESPGTRQKSEAESLNYAALQFSRRKVNAEKRKTNSSDECAYSDVKYNCRI